MMSIFKNGRFIVRLDGRHLFYHPEGTDVDGFPYFFGYGSFESRSGDKPEVNLALEAFREEQIRTLHRIAALKVAQGRQV